MPDEIAKAPITQDTAADASADDVAAESSVAESSVAESTALAAEGSVQSKDGETDRQPPDHPADGVAPKNIELTGTTDASGDNEGPCPACWGIGARRKSSDR